jgi:hypothetical protein
MKIDVERQGSMYYKYLLRYYAKKRERKKLLDIRNFMLTLSFFFLSPYFMTVTFLEDQVSKIRERRREREKKRHDIGMYVGTRVRRNMTLFRCSLFHNHV